MSAKKLNQLLKLNKHEDDKRDFEISTNKSIPKQHPKGKALLETRNIDKVRRNIEKQKQRADKSKKLTKMYENRAKVKKSVVERISNLI